MAIDLLLVVLAFVSFTLGAVGVVVPRVNLVATGLALWMLTMIV
jgi:hypothetical protein